MCKQAASRAVLTIQCASPPHFCVPPSAYTSRAEGDRLRTMAAAAASCIINKGCRRGESRNAAFRGVSCIVAHTDPSDAAQANACNLAPAPGWW